jgi:hypothetical protein
LSLESTAATLRGDDDKSFPLSRADGGADRRRCPGHRTRRTGRHPSDGWERHQGDLSNVHLTPLKTADRFEVKTFTRFTASQLDGDRGWIEVDFDTNADRTYDFWVAVFYHKGKLIALQGHRSNVIRQLPARRVDPRTISFEITHNQLDGVHSYDFAAVSVWRAAPCSNKKPCVDTIPNRYPLLRYDFTPPTVSQAVVPDISTNVSDTLTFPVSFKVKDDRFGSGLKSWTLESRAVGTTTWSTEKKGTSGSPLVDVTAAEGETVAFRVVAVDRQGNKTVQGIGQTSVPVDDRNGVLVYSVAPTQTARSGAFLGTISAIAQNETVSYTVTLSDFLTDVCIIGGRPVTAATTAQATYAIDGGPTSGMTEDGSTPDLQQEACPSLSAGVHTIVVTGQTAEPFVVDAVLVHP